MRKSRFRIDDYPAASNPAQLNADWNGYGKRRKVKKYVCHCSISSSCGIKHKTLSLLFAFPLMSHNAPPPKIHFLFGRDLCAPEMALFHSEPCTAVKCRSTCASAERIHSCVYWRPKIPLLRLTKFSKCFPIKQARANANANASASALVNISFKVLWCAICSKQ